MRTYCLSALTVRTIIAILALLAGVTSVGAYAPGPVKAQAQDSLREQASSDKSDDISAQTIHKTGFVQVNGANLYYEVRGNKAAAKRFPPIILVHGLSLD